MNAPPLRWSPGITASVWALLGAAACAAMIPLEPSLLEEGLILHIAQRLVRGERLYRDIAAFTGPLPFELLAALFRLFGENIAVGRMAVVVLQGGACASLYLLARRAEAGSLAHAATACLASAPVLLFPLYSTFFYTTLALALSLIAACAALWGTRSTGWAVVAGVLVSCVALSKQTVGVFLAPALLAGLMVGTPPGKRARRALAMTLGAALVVLLVVVVYGAQGDLAVFVRSLVAVPLSLGETFSTPYMNLWPIGRFAPGVGENHSFSVPHLYNILMGRPREVGVPIVIATQILFALPFAGLVATALRRLKGPLPAAVWIHAAVLVALTANLFPRPDWGHLVFALPPAAAQLLLVCRTDGGGRRLRLVSLAVTAALLLTLSTGAWVAGRRLHDLAAPPSFGVRVPQRPVSKACKSPGVPRAIRFLQQRARPGEAIFVARAEPLIYFATETRNPTPYGGVIPGLREPQERAILAALDDVRFVVMSEVDQPQFLYYGDELPAVQAHLERHFQVPKEYTQGKSSWILVLERGPDRGPTAVDLLEARDRARPWVRERSGVRRPASASPPRLASRHNRRPLPLLLGPHGGGIDFDLEIPENAVFQADIGLRRASGPARRHTHPKRTRLVLSIRRDDRFETLASVPVGFRQRESRYWRPLEVDLSAYAGRSVTLRLELKSDAPLEPGSLAWWGGPRIALRPGS